MLQQIYNSILLPGREEEAKVLMLSLISKQHAVLIGAPGTAKSLQISMLAESFNAPLFSYLLTKYTLPHEIFGAPDVKELRETGKTVTVTTNKLPEAKLAFIDEVFKGSSAILNCLLKILNERKFDRGDKEIKVPLWTCLSASNEIPEEPELQALYDRFQYRHWVDYVPPEKWEELLDTYWVIHNPAYNRQNSFDFKVIEQAHGQVFKVNPFTVKKQLLTIFAKLQDQNIVISDRRKGRCLLTLASNAVLNNRNVTPEDLLALKYTIPENKEQVKIVEQTIIDVAGEQIKAKQQLQELLPQVRGLIEQLESANDFQEALKIAEQFKPLASKISDLKAYSDLPEHQELERLMKEFSSILAKKVV
ncbi:MoxR family ATPase [Archaeoglobales archaeon]|nr:MAG: MoxR family ATPase [Archaeoglobales archaeon]